MKYLIDANICIYIMNKRPPGIIKKFKAFEVGEIGVSTITVSELGYGVSKGIHREKNQRRLEQFLAPFDILAYDEMAAKFYVDIRLQLEKNSQPIGPLDALIAAHTLSRDLVLVTNNDREFERIENLQVENWARRLP